MNDNDEVAYIRGSRMAWLFMLKECQRQLGYDTPEAQAVSWQAEREEAVSILRGLCAEFGDNEWNEHLHLADVIDKHLGNHLKAGHVSDIEHPTDDQEHLRLAIEQILIAARELGEVKNQSGLNGFAARLVSTAEILDYERGARTPRI